MFLRRSDMVCSALSLLPQISFQIFNTLILAKRQILTVYNIISSGELQTKSSAQWLQVLQGGQISTQGSDFLPEGVHCIPGKCLCFLLLQEENRETSWKRESCCPPLRGEVYFLSDLPFRKPYKQGHKQEQIYTRYGKMP